MSVTIDLGGKVTLVTGSSRGIGRAIAEVLADAGADVVLNAREMSEELKSLATDIADKYGVRCEAIPADVSVAADVNTMFQRVFKTFGRLDALVNNAGILRDGLIGMIRKDRSSIDDRG